MKNTKDLIVRINNYLEKLSESNYEEEVMAIDVWDVEIIREWNQKALLWDLLAKRIKEIKVDQYGKVTVDYKEEN